MYLMKGSLRVRAQVKLWTHIVAFILATGVTAIAGVRMLTTRSTTRSVSGNGGQRSMSGQIALSMGAKSLLFIIYQFLADHKIYFKERLRVNLVLNLIESIAWPAVVAFTMQGVLKRCVGTSCTLSWVIFPLGIILSMISTLAAFISIGDWQYFKRHGVHPSDDLVSRDDKSDQIVLEESGGPFAKIDGQESGRA